MQQLVEVRRRMKSIGTILTVSRTMATVAAAKLSRTRVRAAGMRLYSDRLRAAIRRQQRQAEEAGLDLSTLSPFLVPRFSKRIALVHLSGDRGMCGNYNNVVNREAALFLEEQAGEGREVEVFAKGLHGARFLVRKTDAGLLEAEGWRKRGVTDEEVERLYGRVTEWFLSGAYDEVWCTYTQFYSPVRRYPRRIRLLPLSPEDLGHEPVAGMSERWFHEPDLASTLAAMLGVFLKLQVEDVLLEAYAAEQGARMITMQEAAERAERTMQELTVAYNRLRRETITADLLGVLVGARVRSGEEEVGTVM